MGLPSFAMYIYYEMFLSDKNSIFLLCGLDLISFSIFRRYQKAPKILRSA